MFTPKYGDLSRYQKRIILSCLDFLVSTFSIFLAFTILYNIGHTLELFALFLPLITGYIVFKVVIFQLFGLYRPVLKYTDLSFLSTISKSVLFTSVIGVFLINLFADRFISESVIIIDGLISIVAVTALRLTIRSVIKSLTILESDSTEKQKLVIYGAGSAGYQLSQSLEQNPEYRLLAFVDDNPEMQGRVLQDVPIYSPHYLESLYKEESFQTIIFAIPNLTIPRRKEIVEHLKALPVQFKTIPTFGELLSNQASLSQIRNINITELLGREEITPYQSLLRVNITDKAVLVTGAGGSIGSEICRQIAQLQPKCLVLFELNELALYTIDMELREQNLNVPIYPYLGNITDKGHFESILKLHRIETIYHAAAYKHVPLVEMNPSIGVYNNVAGTLITARSAIDCGVKNFVLISTDKAVRPTNVMGASKRVAELLIQALAAQNNIGTIFAIVRFGNVLNSSGSVIPRFRKQISEGKAITLTHKDVTRYFISIPEAVSLVIQAGAMAKGGEIFLLDMGNPVRIYDLAVKMIELNGLIPEKDIPINIVGLRPGEKLYEELLIDKNNSNNTQHPQIFYGNEPMLSWEMLETNLENLLYEAKEKNSEEVVKLLKILVPEFNHPLKEVLVS
ncbi:nucleoside-diphosphate sugar epimerase/dehydratase [Geminocystis sp. NIES-3709]|uniref:polysaccharide biosynthesis protein n=1 Tax=Geminocystis sp. NIES-3709 TaxID=1617448 RepID=UPI001E42AEED|nr:nucleoside-diphosphate sugar epimerase/dehydratase [Geminocystis sp. NIES-3709]